MNAPNNFPPPPPVPAQPGVYAPPAPQPAAAPVPAQQSYAHAGALAPAYAAPAAVPTPPYYQAPAAPPAPPPAHGYASQPPQGFAAPAAPGFSQQTQQQMPSTDLNAVRVGDLNLLPQVAFTGRLRMVGYVKGVRDSGPAYTISVVAERSDVPQLPAGVTFSILCKMTFDPKKNGGDKQRKKILGAVFNTNPNAPADWNAFDLQLQQRDFRAQPTYLDLVQVPNYGRPILDKQTKQPLPGQFWCDQNWSHVPATA